MTYKVPVSELAKVDVFNKRTSEVESIIDFWHDDIWNAIIDFITHHRTKQVPRLKELKRYLHAENNIKFRPNKPENRSDNRIASDFSNFIVSFKLGVLLGNPLKYTGDEATTAKIVGFNSRNDEGYHNQLMGYDTFGLGRAYEWVGRDEDGKESLAKFDAEQTFVIYDNTKEANPICAVHYYVEEFLDKKWTQIEVYTALGVNYFSRVEGDNLRKPRETEIVEEESYFEHVQINEWINNEDRMSDFERVLDSIDAYDLSRSELANFQQDSSEAFLVIKGNPETAEDETGENSPKEVIDAMLRARMLILGDKKNYGDGEMGSDPDAYYLKKEYDASGIESNDDRTVADILRFTSLIDFTDESMGGNQSGIGFRFKGWGSDNDRKNKERMVKKALMRRLRLLAESWTLKESLNDATDNIYDRVNEVSILFTPNVPQSDEEIMKVISGMVGIVSDETLCEMAEKLTGVSAQDEIKRLKKELNDKTDMNQFDFEKEQESEDEE